MIDVKPIQSSLKSWMQKNDNFQENYKKIRAEVLNDPEISELLSHHPQLTQQEINKNLIKLYEYMTQSKQCSGCASFEACQNMLQGYSPILKIERDEIHLSYEKCHSRKMHEQDLQKQKLIKSLYMPREILQAKMADIDYGETRTLAIGEILDFLDQAKAELPEKGLYLHGKFGVGKTFLLGALANELKKYNISSTLIYMPEFVRELKSSFKDDSFNEKLDHFKKANVLMLDDIGAEMQSAWFRDEILGSVLQYRMMERLPTFFTSNFDLDQLEYQLAATKNGVEQVKAGRIIERIRQVSKPIKLDGENRRV